MSDLTITADDQVLLHTVVAIRRTGAVALEVGWTDDDPPRCYATAAWRGAKVSCDNQPDVVSALLGLYAMIAAGGSCVSCGRTVALTHSARGLIDGARMRDGGFETRGADPRRSYCVRRLGAEGWVSDACHLAASASSEGSG